MCPERLTAEEQAFVDRGATAVMSLRAALLDTAALYQQLEPTGRGLEGDSRERAHAEVERIAELWREGELAGSWEIERELGWEGPNDLLGAYADSLTLALSSDPERRASVVEVDEGLDRLEALEEQGAFEQLERKGAAPDAGAESPYEEQLVERFDALADNVIIALGEAFAFYRELAPDGQELGARSVDAVEHLERAAVASLLADAGRGLVERYADRTPLRPTMEILRAMQNGLVLALSEDPARRAKAMPVDELGARLRPVHTELKGSQS